ncbi:MAG: SH3 domain-containing protein [Candidatus Dormibacteria bacterium]
MTTHLHPGMATPARWTCAVLATLGLAGCATSGAPTGVATNPPAHSPGTRPGGATPSAAAATGVRTVLSPLGLNIRGGPATTAARLGTAAQGAVLSVVGHTDQNGGWYNVQGQTVSGWITADPTLTAAGQFTQYQSQDRLISALYPQDWTFDEVTTSVFFHPMTGAQTIVVRNAAQVADFGPAGGTGFIGSGQQTVVVCGVTGDLNVFTHTGGAPPTPTPGTAGPLALLAQIRLRLDATHALALDYNYSAAADLEVFNDFYNSITFPYPACQQTASPVPAPT